MSEDSNNITEQQDTKSTINWKMLPLILIYQLWTVAILQAFGWAAALPSTIVTGAWLMGWPKGLLRNIAFVVVFGFVIPLTVVSLLGIEPNTISK